MIDDCDMAARCQRDCAMDQARRIRVVDREADCGEAGIGSRDGRCGGCGHRLVASLDDDRVVGKRSGPQIGEPAIGIEIAGQGIVVAAEIADEALSLRLQNEGAEVEMRVVDGIVATLDRNEKPRAPRRDRAALQRRLWRRWSRDAGSGSRAASGACQMRSNGWRGPGACLCQSAAALRPISAPTSRAPGNGSCQEQIVAIVECHARTGPVRSWPKRQVEPRPGDAPRFRESNPASSRAAMAKAA